MKVSFLFVALSLTVVSACAATVVPDSKPMSRQDVCIYDGSLVEKVAFGRDNGVSAPEMRRAIDDDLRREPGFSPFFRSHISAIVSWVYQNPGVDKTSAMRSYYDDCMRRG